MRKIKVNIANTNQTISEEQVTERKTLPQTLDFICRFRLFLLPHAYCASAEQQRQRVGLPVYHTSVT